MLSDVNSADQITAARLLDFFDAATPWHRCLWNPGLVLTLAETLEASEALRAGVLHEESVRALANTCLRLSGSDSAAKTHLPALQPVLSSKLRFEGLDYHVLKESTDRIEANYLKLWSDALRSDENRPKAERAARSIASHLLDLGFSSDYLHHWWSFKLRHETGIRSLADIVEEAHSLARRPTRAFDVLVAFNSSPRTKSGYPKDWLNASQVSEWLRGHSFSVAGLRPSGGLVLCLQARDSQAASYLAGEAIDNFLAKISVGTGDVVTALPSAWVSGAKQPYQLGGRLRGVRVRALYREDKIYPSGTQPSILDPALELLAHLERSSPSAAVAGGWAAIEALLSEPNDRGAAAERLASLVACSFPRAELTVLSYVLEKSEASVRAQLKACIENRDRCAAIAAMIKDARPVSLPSFSDTAALARMKKVLQSPRRTLDDVKAYVADAFARLYRQRNLVLHWGKTNAVALRASLRTAAPLVGAGMDRIAHGVYVQGLNPIELAARARISLKTVGDGSPESCLDLLA